MRAAQAPHHCATVEFLGPPGTFSHQVARSLFEQCDAAYDAQPSIRAAIGAAAAGRTHGPATPRIVVFPYANSAQGRVIETVDAMAGDALFGPMALRVVGDTFFSISHALIVRSAPCDAKTALGSIEVVRSHPQVCARHMRGVLTPAGTRAVRGLPRRAPPSRGARCHTVDGERGRSAAVAR